MGSAQAEPVNRVGMYKIGVSNRFASSSSSFSNKMTEKNQNTTQIATSNFSIDYILNNAGSSSNSNIFLCGSEEFSWLHCSRYCPPKVERQHRKKVSQKRQLGRHPRIPFTSFQLSVLEKKFEESPYLSSEEVTQLSKILEIADVRVKIWFQNRRARQRREKTPHRDSSIQKSTNDTQASLLNESSTSKSKDLYNLFMSISDSTTNNVKN